MMIRDGELDEAEELLRGVLREAEVNGDAQRMSEAYEGLGAVAAERGEAAIAIGLLEQARDAGAPPDPAERVELFGRLFQLYRSSGDVARALALLQDCLAELRRAPVVDATKIVRYAVWLSRAYNEAGRHLIAARNLLGAHPSATDHGRILVEDARQALLLGDATAAAQRADQAVRALGEGDGAHLGDAHLVLARVQDELGELERADAAYTAAIEAIRTQDASARDLARAYRWYGKFLKRIGRAEAALEAFELAADLAPSNQDALAPTEARSGTIA
jgi:tetratricopeptide (TPR) repeat protein